MEKLLVIKVPKSGQLKRKMKSKFREVLFSPEIETHPQPVRKLEMKGFTIVFETGKGVIFNENFRLHKGIKNCLS